MKIPFLGIGKYYIKNKSDILNITDRVFSTGKLMNGEELTDFEREIAVFCGRKFARLVGSCTDALYFALQCIGIQPGDEVIVSDFSFIASASPIIRSGAIPVFADIDEKNYMMDVESIEKNITSKTKAIIAVHLFGQMMPVAPLIELSNKYQIQIIEDAAQALGACQYGVKAGSLGSVSCISFDPTKIVGAFGNSGCILFDNPEMVAKIEMLRYHGKQKNEFISPGFNSRTNTLQAALLLYQLQSVQNNISIRNSIADIYGNSLDKIDKTIRPIIEPNNSHTFHKFVISTDFRDELKKHLEQNGIEIKIHYEKPLHEYGIFKKSSKSFLYNVRTEQVCKKLLSLPIYPELSPEDINYIVSNINNFFKNADSRSR